MVGDLLAAHDKLPAYGAALGATLARAMQEDTNILAFVAYKNDVVGAMVTFAHADHLAAMLLGGADGALRARLRDEAASRGLEALILEPLPQGAGPSLLESVALELWTVR